MAQAQTVQRRSSLTRLPRQQLLRMTSYTITDEAAALLSGDRQKCNLCVQQCAMVHTEGQGRLTGTANMPDGPIPMQPRLSCQASWLENSNFESPSKVATKKLQQQLASDSLEQCCAELRNSCATRAHCGARKAGAVDAVQEQSCSTCKDTGGKHAEPTIATRRSNQEFAWAGYGASSFNAWPEDSDVTAPVLYKPDAGAEAAGRAQRVVKDSEPEEEGVSCFEEVKRCGLCVSPLKPAPELLDGIM